MHCLKMSCSLMKKLFAYEAKCCRRDCVHFGCKHYIQEESSICIVSLRATFLWLEEALLLELWKVRERKPGTTTTVRKKGRSSRTYYRLVHHSTRKTYLRYKIAELNSSAQSAAATQIIKHEQSAPYSKFLIYKKTMEALNNKTWKQYAFHTCLVIFILFIGYANGVAECMCK